VTIFNRRRFLTLSSSSLVSVAASQSLSARFRGSSTKLVQDYSSSANTRSCWLEVCAPFIVQDPTLGIESELVLTSDNFIGASGYSDGVDATEYQIFLYDSEGKLFGDNGSAKQLIVPAMQTTVLPIANLLPDNMSFWGGLKVRLKPRTRIPSHPSDLFSSAFIRWKTKDSFTNVHANPDPLQWQSPKSFFYSMPFPPLREYDCYYSLFNPYAERSIGRLVLYDPFGAALKEFSYDLKPHSSTLVDLQKGEFVPDTKECFSVKDRRSRQLRLRGSEQGGTVAVTNAQDSVKNFGYLLIRQSHSQRFTIEHPIHQQPYNPLPITKPFDSAGRFHAKNILYTPLVFNQKRIGGVTLSSRFHLSSGAPMEAALWLSPFITDGEGNVVWQMGPGMQAPKTIPSRQIEHDAIKLPGQQSCLIDATELTLPKGFSGGLSLAISPLSNHMLMKVELRVLEWDSPAFTHFRPGLASARAYQKPPSRAGLATDYIGSGARLETRNNRMVRDEIVAVINIDDKNIAGNPTLEVFGKGGFISRVSLGTIPAFSCRHFLLSTLVSGKIPTNDLSLRLLDEKSTLLMSVVHLDYDRRDIAADHGSDRFSTFSEFTCQSTA